jgi:hypothetical protein
MGLTNRDRTHQNNGRFGRSLLLAALGATRLLRSLLYEVQANDFVTYLLGVL